MKIFGLARGANRLPSRNVLDVRVEKEFSVHDGQVRFTADIFNLFNTGYATQVIDVFETDNFGLPLSLTRPREARLGIRYSF